MSIEGAPELKIPEPKSDSYRGEINYTYLIFRQITIIQDAAKIGEDEYCRCIYSLLSQIPTEYMDEAFRKDMSEIDQTIEEAQKKAEEDGDDQIVDRVWVYTQRFRAVIDLMKRWKVLLKVEETEDETLDD
jgi:hypothetical protein